MSEYCSQCTPFKNRFDIDLLKIALKLDNGRSVSFLCEGCNNRAVYRDDIGLLYLAKAVNGEIELVEVTVEGLMITKEK